MSRRAMPIWAVYIERNSEMKRHILPILAGATVCAFANVKSYDFSLTESTPGKVVLDFDKQNLAVELKDNKQLLAHFTDSDEADLNDFTEFMSTLQNVIFADYNFDGYTDIGVLMGTGYSGTNEYRDYYFYDPDTQKYILQIKNACNLEIFSKKHRMFLAWEKSGSSAYSETYMIDKHGNAFLVLSAVGTWSQNKKREMVYTYDANATVSVDRAYYYDVPGGRKSRVYVVKGDHVEVLDVLKEKGDVWVKVGYKTRRKIYKGWINSTNLRFEELRKKEK